MPWDALAADLEPSVHAALVRGDAGGPAFYAGIAGAVAPADAMRTLVDTDVQSADTGQQSAWLDGSTWRHPDDQARSVQHLSRAQ